MLAVIYDLVSVQMIASLSSDVIASGLVSFLLSYQLETDLKEPTLLYKKSRAGRPH